jgi:Holliday junction resolvasome RuvABC ATP-dependent DNA helicase subunit
VNPVRAEQQVIGNMGADLAARIKAWWAPILETITAAGGIGRALSLAEPASYVEDQLWILLDLDWGRFPAAVRKDGRPLTPNETSRVATMMHRSLRDSLSRWAQEVATANERQADTGPSKAPEREASVPDPLRSLAARLNSLPDQVVITVDKSRARPVQPSRKANTAAWEAAVAKGETAVARAEKKIEGALARKVSADTTDSWITGISKVADDLRKHVTGLREMGRPDLAERLTHVIAAEETLISQLKTYAGEQRPTALAAGVTQPRSQTGRLDDLLRQLDALTGLSPVKAEVRQLINIVRVEQMRRAAGLPVTRVSRHLVFIGNPGTGKTTVARLLGQLYTAIGVLRTGQLIETARSDLVAGYVGQTAIKTTEMVNKALGGILFIDEAYALTKAEASGQDFGQEAVDTLVKLMEDHRDDLIVIVAGYGNEMTRFISSNPGLPSRFPRTIHFPDYGTDELIAIFQGMCQRGQYQPSADALDVLRQYLAGLPRTREFGNGRLVRNLFEAALARQASRIVESGSSDLTRLTMADLGLAGPAKHYREIGGTTKGPYL